jgi:hypothetical protein
MSLEFWDSLQSDYVLLFEADTILCPHPTIPIEWWIGRYAYVGSPWFGARGAGQHWCRLLACCVGNSGLSLWDRTLTAGLLRSRQLLPQIGRLVDLWASRHLQSLAVDGKLPAGLPAVPSEEIAGAFSCGEPPGNWHTGGRDNWYSAADFIPVGMHGVSTWPLRARATTPSTAICPPEDLPGRIFQRCVHLVARCPAVHTIALNKSLDGERADDADRAARVRR